MKESQPTLPMLCFLAVVLALPAGRGYAQTDNSIQTPNDGSVLPFPPTPLRESVIKPRLQDSSMKWPAAPRRLPAGAPTS